MSAPEGVVQQLHKALRQLRNEIVGLLGLVEAELRESVGHTNVNVLHLRIAEADIALSAPDPWEGHQRGCAKRAVDIDDNPVLMRRNRCTCGAGCLHGDTLCPCQDGDPCNHEPLPLAALVAAPSRQEQGREEESRVAELSPRTPTSGSTAASNDKASGI